MCVRPTVRNLRKNIACEVYTSMFFKPEKLFLAATAIIVSDTGKIRDKEQRKKNRVLEQSQEINNHETLTQMESKS